MKNIFIIGVILLLKAVNSFSQESKMKISAVDGVIVAGYVDHGAYLNFTGPNLNFTYKQSKFILGMLPSLKFKEDNSEIRNSLVTPSLGVGFTYCYKHFAFQLPMYYSPKTTTQHGKWNLGIGVGVRLYKSNKK